MGRIADYYLQNGGVINVAIFLIAVVSFYIGSGKLFQFHAMKKKRVSGNALFGGEKKPIQVDEWYFDFLYNEFVRNPGHSQAYYKNRFREILLKRAPEFNEGLDTMAALTGAAPLLGLLGTVMGMIKTFKLITTYGSANPVILTEGITVSLLTTQAGLIVAFPCLLFHNYVNGRKNALVKEVLSQGEKLITRFVTGRKQNNV